MARRKRPEIAGVGEQIFGTTQDDGAPDLLPQVASVYLEDVPVDTIDPNPHQPRDGVEHDDALDELAASIRERGVLQPIRVRPQGDRYQLIAGERRWRAAQLAGLAAVPAIVVDVDDAAMRIEAIIENLQREDLNEIERANALRELKEALNLTWDDVAARVGLTRRSIMRIVGLTTLPEPVQALIADGHLSEKHGRALRRLNDAPGKQAELAKIAVAEGLSGDDTEALVKTMQGGESAARRERVIGQALSVIDDAATDLSKVFAKLADASPRKREREALRNALGALEEALRSLQTVCAEKK